MKQSGKCPKCGSQNIIENARPAPSRTAGVVELAVYDKPEALFFKGEKDRYELGAWVCTGCGYTEFYCL